MKKPFNFLLIGFLLMVGNLQPLFSQQEIPKVASNLLRSLKTMEVMYPQQKIYLQLDKQEYFAGEKVWLKAYLVNATEHLPDTMKANLYVEMINVNEEPVNVVVLHSENGLANGYIELHDSLPEGNYLVRAFNTWMNNFSQELFFEKRIFVHNPIEKNFIRRPGLRQNNRFNKEVKSKHENMVFHLFPEGGDLVQGLENRVAFKASNAFGHGMKAAGELIDGNGKEITRFQTTHDGMGYFTFTPVAGMIYQANIEFENGHRQRVDLPDARSEGYLMNITPGVQEIKVKVQANFDPQSYGIGPEVFLLGQTRSKAYFMEQGTLEDGMFQTRIDTELLPSGVCQITLFDVNGLPLAERLVFVNHHDIRVADISTRQLDIDDYHALEIDIQMDMDAQNAAPGSYSLAVVASQDPFEPISSNIASYLLLSSDVDNHIHAPWQYLANDSTQTSQALDLLMLTHGWRRFDWDKILAEDYPDIYYGRASGLTIAGQVSPTSSANPTGEISVQMIVNQDGRNVHTAQTDLDGNFRFSDIFYKDYFLAQFTIPRDPIGRNLRISLNSRDFEDIRYNESFGVRPTSVVSRGDHWEKIRTPRTSLAPSRRVEPDDGSSIYGNADQVIFMQDLQGHFTTVYEVLRSRATGFMVHDGQVMLRGPTSINLSSEPLFMIDGVAAHRQVFFNTPPADLDRLEILKGPSAAIYGVRGSNGVILAYTKRGTQQTQRTVDYMLIGFQSPREFSPANINTSAYRDEKVDRTLFWEPDIIPNDNGNASVIFQIAEPTEHVRIIFEGIDQNGNIAFKEYILKQNLSVKAQ